MLIYDGDCGFCTRSARWLEDRLPTGYLVVPWQGLPELTTLGLTEEDVRTAAYWVDGGGNLFRGHRAVAHALIHAGGGWWLAGRLLLIPPISWLAAIAYRAVASSRGRMPGATAACGTTPRSEQSLS